jgi:hypothetical protein
MVRRTTWILLVIFVVLVGFTWIFQRYQENKAKNVATLTPTVAKAKLYDIDSTQVKEINISDSLGKQIAVYIDPITKKWAVKDVPAEQADSFQIESITAQLFSLQVQETITNTPSLDSVGLASPLYTITMTKSDDTQLVTNVGSKTAIGSGYYVRVDSGQVVIVDKDVMDNVLNLLTSPPLIPTPTPEISTTGTISPTESSGETPTP